ncbi:MAG: hypothetical protein ACYTF7_06255 [Planctomycetota bacterium]|jgi:hypothetical protein
MILYPMPTAQPIRYLHHMACSGGSIIARCLAAMPGVALLSEVHPDMGMRARASALKQAQLAYSLLSEDEIHEHFVRQIETIHANASAQSLHLVIRDHLHADLIAPGHFRHLTWECLDKLAPSLRCASVRHPIDVWLGLQHNNWLEWTIPQYCARLVHVARSAAQTGFIRYEDFTLDPSDAMERLCARLEISFDPEFLSNVESVAHITGASGRQRLPIEPRPRRECSNETLTTFNACPAYHETLDILGYTHPDAYPLSIASQHVGVSTRS